MSWRDHLPGGVRRALHLVRSSGDAVVRAGAQPVLTVRLLASPNLRRAEPRNAHRLVVASVGAVLVVVVAAAVAVLTGAWWVLVLAFLPFVVSAVRAAWRGRAGRGVDRGLPRGRVGRGPGWLLGPEWFADQARRYGPVFKTNFVDAPAVCVVDLPAGTALLRDAADALGPPWRPYDQYVPGGSVRGSEGARHQEVRRIFARALGPDAVRAWTPALARSARDCMTALADASERRPSASPREAVRTAVFEAWMHALLGVRSADLGAAELRALVDRLDPDRTFYADPLPDDEMEAGLDRLGAYVRAGARSGTATDTLARRFDDGDARALDDPAVMRNLLLSVLTTRDDVAGLLVWVLWYVAAEPEWRDTLRGARPDDERTARFVSEVLRLEQSEFVMRRTTAPIDHTGPCGRIVVPEDWFVRVCIREIHRDGSVFPEPERFDPGRFAGDGPGTAGRGVYAPFGVDHRACLGELLTRTYAAEFAVAAAQYDLTTVADGPVELSRQRHWAPSSQWRLRVTRPEPNA